ncbi:FHA domain-containing protein [Erwinia oleae]|uniref:FHA domain-containing protein n=1 Tax=Erwinia oleae TaxID=796334 RepID=UPI00055189F2|nr:FHA domain-containing protein [Erwinia oleae]
MFELRVLTGRHQGAALPVMGGEWTLGQGFDADLLLTDSGVAAHHATLFFADERWQLRAAEGKLYTPDGKESELFDPLPPDQPFALGDVWLSLSPAEQPWEAMTAAPQPLADAAPATTTAAVQEAAPAPSRTFSRGVQVLSVSLILLLSFTIISWILQPTVAQTSTTGSNRQVLETLQEVRPPLLAMLRDRGLTPGVKIDMGKGKMVLNGELNKDQLQILERMLVRFQAQYNVIPKLVNNTRQYNAKLPFRIVQITTGKRANVVTDTGERLFIGDQKDELRLVAITSSEVEFAGRDHIKVNW